MAELSTLSPSPSALGDPHAAPSIPPSSAPSLPVPNNSALEYKPKSALYNDNALTGNTSTALSGSSPETPRPPSSHLKTTDETPLPSLVPEVLQREESTGRDVETGVPDIKRESLSSDQVAAENVNTATETPALSGQPSAQSEEQQASPSPDLNPAPNLYPNVRVTHAPNPIPLNVGHFTADRPQTSADSNPTPAPPASTSTASPTVTATAEEENPQPLQQTQNPQSQPPPLSPKPDAPKEAEKAEQPSTPAGGEHPSPNVPLIHEPACALPMYNPKPRPAPDTLSYLESASLMSGTLESLSGLGEDGSSVGSDSEINGLTVKRTDKYGFVGGNQYSDWRYVFRH